MARPRCPMWPSSAKSTLLAIWTNTAMSRTVLITTKKRSANTWKPLDISILDAGSGLLDWNVYFESWAAVKGSDNLVADATWWVDWVLFEFGLDRCLQDGIPSHPSCCYSEVRQRKVKGHIVSSLNRRTWKNCLLSRWWRGHFWRVWSEEALLDSRQRWNSKASFVSKDMVTQR